MKASYDRETDTLIITLRDARIRESDEVRPGVIAEKRREPPPSVPISGAES